MQKILFRADSSSSIGTGHIMRDLVLAKQYPKSKIIFATQKLEGNLNTKILEDGYEVEILDSNSFEELNNLIQKFSIQMLVIDHYEIDYKFEKALKEANPNLIILSFDDTYEKHHCDIVLNHNISADKRKYEGLVPKYCELRCGAKYTLLRDEFIEQKKTKSIFLAMGGADYDNINMDVLEILKEFTHIDVNLVTTTANPNLERLEEYIKRRDWIELHINSNKIAKLMRISDFAIVSPSVTLNEVFFMEIPFIAIQTAKNQEDMANYLKQNDYCIFEYSNLDKYEILNYIKRILFV